MAPWKAPGPDAFPTGFYQKSWSVVGDSIYIRYLWEKPMCIKEVNQTKICLIPKINNPTQVHQFRPISLCSFIYNCLSKLVVNRLKVCINEVVGPFQTGFIKGTSIHENIIRAQELIHNMNIRQGKTWYFVIKVGLTKVYDNLSWSFIHKVISEASFPHSLIHVIMNVVTSFRLSIKWMGIIPVISTLLKALDKEI